MFEFINDIYNYDSRKVDKTEINGIEVSTAFTSDEGYETAILDENGVHPVERYETKELAIKGHKKWCKEAETLKSIKKLGWLGILDDVEIELKRK